MEDVTAFSALGMHMVDNFLVVPINVELHDDYVVRLRKEILEKVTATGAKGVLIDVSVVKIFDGFSFSILADTARMISMLGAEAVMVGIQAGVALALVDLEIDMGDIQTAVTMDDGFDLLRSRVSPWVKPKEPETGKAVMDFDEVGEINEFDGG